MAIKKVSTTSATAAKASAAATNTKKVVFEPLPGAVTATESTQPKKLYVTLGTKEYRVNTCTLHKGTPDEVTFSFVNAWDDINSVSIYNPSIAQLREIQSTYTRVRGFNVVKFNNKITVYRMQVLTDAELATAYEK